jgi:uncharacterized membrane protein
MTSATQIDWKIPLTLLLVSAIPFVAGIARIAGLAGNSTISPENARFVAEPLTIILHIIGASLFSILGALQFSTQLRLRKQAWHKISGRIAVASGIVCSVSGFWMTVRYSIPQELQGNLLYAVRIVVSFAMLASIALSVTAAFRHEVTKHRAWMIRTYALGQGAGMQVVVLLPWMLLIGTPSTLQRDMLMTLAWLINLFIAEWAIRRWNR